MVLDDFADYTWPRKRVGLVREAFSKSVDPSFKCHYKQKHYHIASISKQETDMKVHTKDGTMKLKKLSATKKRKENILT